MLAAQIEQLRRAILAGDGEEAPATEICKAVAGGAAAGDVIGELVAAYNATYSKARARLALAITIDLLRRGDVARWIELRGGRSDLDAALLEADNQHDVSPFIFVLASVEGAVPTIVTWCRRKPEQRMTELATHLTDEALVAFARGLGDKDARAPLVARLADILARRREPVLRSKAAEQLLHAATLGWDTRTARDALRAALDDDAYFGSPAEDAAHLLALMGEPGLDRDPRRAVRLGAWHARSSFLALVDPDPTNRARMAWELRERLAKDETLCPSRDEVKCLVAEVRDPIVAELLYAVIDRGEVAAVVAELEPRGMTRHLVAAARAVLDHAPPPVCRTCWKIPRHGSETTTGPSASEAGETSWKCAECGAAYRSQSYDMDDIYGSVQTSTDRLPPEDPAEVARWRDRLDHPELWVRRDAAWIVGRLAARTRDNKLIDELVTHPDVEVRREAWRVLPGDLLVRALDDTDAEIRRFAASQLVRGGKDPAMLALLLRRDPDIADSAASCASWTDSYPAEVIQAARARLLAARGQSKPDRAFDSVCRLLGGALARTPDQRIVDEAIEIALLAPPAIRGSILYLLAACEATADTSGIDDRIGAALLEPETRTAAAQLLRDRAAAHKPLRVDHLETLATVELGQYDHMRVDVFVDAARVEATRSAGFAGLVVLAGKFNDTMAAAKLHELAKDVPLGDAVPRLLDAAERTTGYAREEIVCALLVDARRRGDRALVAALVDHRDPGLARAARHAERA